MTTTVCMAVAFVCGCSLICIAAAYYHGKEKRPARNVTGLVEFTEYHSGQSCWITPWMVLMVVPAEAGTIVQMIGGRDVSVHGTSESVALALGIKPAAVGV